MANEGDDSRLIRQVYAGALQRDPEERDEYLDGACAGKPELRARVVALLDAHSRDFIAAASDTRMDAARLSDQTDLRRLENQTIGPYIIRRELGHGGMGVVYLADDTRLSRRVALKALNPGLGHDLAGRERLRLEARAAAGLSHPGIATVYALEEIDDRLYLACEYVPGEPLRALLKSGPLPIDQVVDIGVQLARALAAAHTQGIVHRDIKPENVMKTPSGVVKVLDFGLARMEGPGRTTRITQAGVILGTPAYLSPEQALGQAVDFRSDIFALGLVLYELTAGLNPFDAKSITATIARIVEESPPPLSDVQPQSGPDLDRIVATCLQKDPRDRYQSTQEVVVDLEHLQADRLDARRAASPRGSGSAAYRPQPRRPRWWWEMHQLVVSAIYIAMLYPAWYVRPLLPRPWGIWFLLSVLAAAAAATSLRLHVWFVARFFPTEVLAQQWWTRSRVRWCDAAFGLMQVVAAVAIGGEHPEFAMLFVAVAAGITVAAFVIEPVTARVAFGEGRDTSRRA